MCVCVGGFLLTDGEGGRVGVGRDGGEEEEEEGGGGRGEGERLWVGLSLYMC